MFPVSHSSIAGNMSVELSLGWMRAVHSTSDLTARLPAGHTTPSGQQPMQIFWGTPTIVRAVTFTPSYLPWWCWWNLLSLDAPSVALAWAVLFSRYFGFHLSVAERCALVLTIWIIYVSDRLLDSRKGRDPFNLQDRHLFCDRHRVTFTGVAAFAFAVDLWIAAKFLPLVEMLSGVCLAVIVLLYLLSIHACRVSLPHFLPKELVVGLLFAAGTALPLWSRNAKLPSPAWLSFFLFATLCSINCLSIECWESQRPLTGRAPQPLLVRWVRPRLLHLCAGLTAISLLLQFAIFRHAFSAPVFLALALAALVIFLLHQFEARLSRPTLRVLVDLALLLAAMSVLLIRL
jgi:hypothetical protein